MYDAFICVFNEKKIVDTLYKFSHIIKEKFSSNDQALYTDYDFSLPFWFFPIRRNRMNNQQIALIKIIGIGRRQLFYSDLFIYLLSLIFLLVNTRLLVINWDLNFKIFHSKYSFTNTFCFLLLLIDIIFIILLLEPVNNQSEKNLKALETSKINRKKFIRLSIVLATSCFLIEPIFSKLFNGSKWYHTPRFLNKFDDLYKAYRNKSIIKKGLYVNKSRANGGVYYFNKDRKSPCLKTIGNTTIEGFLKNINWVNSTTLINNKRYLKRIQEKVLLQFILEKNLKKGEEISLVKRYLEISGNFLSREFIDLATKTFAGENLYRPKYRKVLQRLLEEIVQVKNKHALLRNDYVENANKLNPNSHAIIVNTANQQLKRFKKWDNRIFFAHL